MRTGQGLATAGVEPEAYGLLPHEIRRHRHAAYAGLPMAGPVHDAPLPAATEGRDAPAAQPRPRTGYLWALLLARIYEIFPLSWPPL